MKTHFLRSVTLGCAAMIGMVCSYAGAQATPGNMQLVSANAVLVQNVDSKNATQGQKVEAKLTSDVKEAGQTELPKGTMLVGMVDQVERSKTHLALITCIRPPNSCSTYTGPATLSIVFDQARLSNGQRVPIKVTILSAYPGNSGLYYDETGDEGSMRAPQPPIIPDGRVVDQQPGTLGNVEMRSSVLGNASAEFTSKDRDINLKRGTRFQIAIASETGAASS